MKTLLIILAGLALFVATWYTTQWFYWALTRPIYYPELKHLCDTVFHGYMTVTERGWECLTN